MDFNLSAEQKLIQKATRDFAEREIAPVVEQMEKGAKFNYPITCFSLIMAVCNSVANMIGRYGNEEQKEKYIRGISDGKLTGSFSFTEPATGSDTKSLTTKAELEGNRWVINGTKRFNTMGGYDGPAMVFARVGEVLECFIVDKNCDGYSITEPWNFMGYVGLPTVDTYLNNVRVPEENLLGGKGKGFEILIQFISDVRICSCTRSLAVGQAALDESIKYARQRNRRGSPNPDKLELSISKFQFPVYARKLKIIS